VSIDWQAKFEAGLPYERFLAQYARAQKDLPRWQEVYSRVQLTADQRLVLSAMVRSMNVLCIAGAWCGDCVDQGPILQRIAEASAGKVDVRFLDRDDYPDAQAEVALCGGHRVPVTVFLSEDFHECARVGDRTLATYRRMAAERVGWSCPTGVGSEDGLLAAATQEWVDHFERVHLMLRLSPRLRKRHGD